MTLPSDTPTTGVQPSHPRVGILGGTGPLGRGLARRLAASGVPVVLGSRDPDRARRAAEELVSTTEPVTPTTEPVEMASVSGGSNAEAASCPIVVVAVPYEGHAALLTELAPVLTDTLVIDCVNPLGFDAQGPYPLRLDDGSAAQEAARVLAEVPGTRVIAAFHHLSAELLNDDTVASLDCDVLVLGEDRADVATGIALAARIPGVRARYGGRLRNAGQVEALTANLIAMNRRYKGHGGIRITGLDS